MTDKPASWTRCRGCSRRGLRPVFLAGCATLFSAIVGLVAFVYTSGAYSLPREQYVPVLGVTMEEKPAGIVIYVMVLFAERDDAEGLEVHSLTGPGRFPRKTQAATVQAIGGAARALGLSTDSYGAAAVRDGRMLDQSTGAAGLSASPRTVIKNADWHRWFHPCYTIDRYMR
jgi:hypothetical protein